MYLQVTYSENRKNPVFMGGIAGTRYSYSQKAGIDGYRNITEVYHFKDNDDSKQYAFSLTNSQYARVVSGGVNTLVPTVYESLAKEPEHV